MNNVDFQRRFAHLLFWANREGLGALCQLKGKQKGVMVRMSWRNLWAGIRYTSFSPLQEIRCITIGIPGIHLVLVWRSSKNFVSSPEAAEKAGQE